MSYHLSLVEIKNDLLNHLTNILYSHILETIMQIYNHSLNQTARITEKINTLKLKQSKELQIFKKKIHNVLNIPIQQDFTCNYDIIRQHVLKEYISEIKNRSSHEKISQYQYIMVSTNSTTILDNLIKSCFKSYLLFITHHPETNENIYPTDIFISSDYYNNIDIPEFINKCYIATCIFFEQNPELFIKKNKIIEIPEIVKNCISTAIKSSIPEYNDILSHYISFKPNKLSHDEEHINNLIHKILNEHKYNNTHFDEDSFENNLREKYKHTKVFLSEEEPNQPIHYSNHDNSLSDHTQQNNTQFKKENTPTQTHNETQHVQKPIQHNHNIINNYDMNIKNIEIQKQEKNLGSINNINDTIGYDSNMNENDSDNNEEDEDDDNNDDNDDDDDDNSLSLKEYKDSIEIDVNNNYKTIDTFNDDIPLKKISGNKKKVDEKIDSMF